MTMHASNYIKTKPFIHLSNLNVYAGQIIINERYDVHVYIIK